jgi:hypothetical protein
VCIKAAGFIYSLRMRRGIKKVVAALKEKMCGEHLERAKKSCKMIEGEKKMCKVTVKQEALHICIYGFNFAVASTLKMKLWMEGS